MTHVFGEPEITEVEPGMWEMSFSHNGHLHGACSSDPLYLRMSAAEAKRQILAGQMICHEVN